MTTLTLRTDGTRVRASGPTVRHVLLTVQAPLSTAGHRARPPVDVAFVIDRSGSMGGPKIHLAREAVVQGLSMLAPTDRFSIVAYDQDVQVVMPFGSWSMTEATQAVRSIEPNGSTNLSGGWLTACMQLAEAPGPRSLRKCLLMSDGQANAGITDARELARHAAELRERGICTSTFGIGHDFDEELMTGMARDGGGQAYYIEHEAQTSALLTSELGETLDTVARDVVVHLRLPDHATLEVLNDFPTSGSGPTQTVTLGHLVSGQTVTVLLRITCPAGPTGASLSLGASVASAEQPASGWNDLAWTFADDEACAAQALDHEVVAAVVRVDDARARREAVYYNRRGNFEGARQALERTAREVYERVGDVDEARTVVARMLEDAAMFEVPMAPSMCKSTEYSSRSVLASRDQAGRARRSGTDPDTKPQP